MSRSRSRSTQQVEIVGWARLVNTGATRPIVALQVLDGSTHLFGTGQYDLPASGDLVGFTPTDIDHQHATPEGRPHRWRAHAEPPGVEGRERHCHGEADEHVRSAGRRDDRDRGVVLGASRQAHPRVAPLGHHPVASRTPSRRRARQVHHPHRVARPHRVGVPPVRLAGDAVRDADPHPQPVSPAAATAPQYGSSSSRSQPSPTHSSASSAATASHSCSSPNRSSC